MIKRILIAFALTPEVNINDLFWVFSVDSSGVSIVYVMVTENRIWPTGFSLFTCSTKSTQFYTEVIEGGRTGPHVLQRCSDWCNRSMGDNILSQMKTGRQTHWSGSHLSTHLPSKNGQALALHRLQGKRTELLVDGQRRAVTGWDHHSLHGDCAVMDAIGEEMSKGWGGLRNASWRGPELSTKLKGSWFPKAAKVIQMNHTCLKPVQQSHEGQPCNGKQSGSLVWVIDF